LYTLCWCIPLSFRWSSGSSWRVCWHRNPWHSAVEASTIRSNSHVLV